MQNIELYDRPDDYYATLAGRFRGLTIGQLDAAARKVLDPDKIVSVVVGDAAKVKPQLDSLGLPVAVVKPPAAPGGQHMCEPLGTAPLPQPPPLRQSSMGGRGTGR